jgi:type III secretion system YscQ/HrcQ family protein
VSNADLDFDPPSSIVQAPAWTPVSFDELPQLSATTEKLRSSLRRLANRQNPGDLAAAFLAETGLRLSDDGPALLDRPSGVKRVGITAHWLVPSHGTSLAIGIETPLAHRVVDRLLGTERMETENHLPTTPVEWGFWTVLAARLTDALNSSGLLPRLVLDRVGPDPFSFENLGPTSTICWELFLHDKPVGMLRAWVPLGLLQAVELKSPPADQAGIDRLRPNLAEISVKGRVQAGVIELSGGLGRLRPKLVLPWPDATLTGAPPDLEGPVICRLADGPQRWSVAGHFVKGSGGCQIEILNRPKPTPTTVLKGPTMSADSSAAASPDLPVTLTVELGRLSISLSRLAELKPGDVLNLSRNKKEPVELTSGDRLVARAELVQIDQELGIRILQVLV